MDETKLKEIEARCNLIVERKWGIIDGVTMRQIERDLPLLIAALREAWVDKERLDWLQANSINRDDNDTPIVDFVLNDGELLRDAIDAARVKP